VKLYLQTEMICSPDLGDYLHNICRVRMHIGRVRVHIE
jgi:hypothetical protein